MFKKVYFLIFIILVSICSFSQNLKSVPNFESFVMDTANIMNPYNRGILNNALQDYSNRNGSQIVIFTMNSIGNEDIFDYSQRVADTWKIGRKGIDDGILILIVKDTRKVNIHIGRGLEGPIPDAYAKRIIDQIISPAFKMGDFDTGIVNAVQQIQKLIAGEKLSLPKKQNAKNSGFEYFFIALIAFPWFFNLIFGRKIGSILLAFLSIIFSFIMGLSLLFCILIGIGFFCFGYFFDRTILINSFGNNNDKWFGGGGFGGGGGFSGGSGGSFGGGGASGGW